MNLMFTVYAYYWMPSIWLMSSLVFGSDEATSSFSSNSTNNIVSDQDCSTMEGQQKVREALYHTLFDHYEKDVRPQGISEGGSLPINVEIAVLSVSEMDLIDSSFELNSWFRLVWYDFRLIWNKNDFCGIEHMIVKSSDQVWIPDISYWVLRGTPVRTSIDEAFLQLHSDGQIFRSTGRQDKIHCEMNLESFPQDVQYCNFTIGSWIHPSTDIKTIARGDTSEPGGLPQEVRNPEMYSPGIDLDHFKQRYTHTVREIIVIPRKFWYYASAQVPYTQLDYSFVVAREPFTYVNVVAWPLVIVTIVAVLSPLYHPRAPGKSTLVVTLLLTLSAIFISASNFIPKLSYPTALAELYSACQIFTLMSLMEAGFSVYLTTIAAEAKPGSMQWNIPMITVILDFIFWYFHIGGIVWRRRVKTCFCGGRRKGDNSIMEESQKESVAEARQPSDKSERNTPTPEIEYFTSLGGSKEDLNFSALELDEEGGISKETHVSPHAYPRRRQCDQGLSQMSASFHSRLDVVEPLTGSSCHTGDVDDNGKSETKERIKPRYRSMNSDAYSARSVALSAIMHVRNGSEDISRDEIYLKKKALERKGMHSKPTFWSLMLVENNGRRKYDNTIEQLVRLYQGEKGLEIPRDEIFMCKKIFLLRLASFVDQVCAVLFPLAFVAFIVYFNRKWHIDWNLHVGREVVLPPKLIFHNTTER